MPERNSDIEKFMASVDDWALRREATEFSEAHGIVDISKRRELLLVSLTDEEKKRLDIIETEVRELNEKIKLLPEVLRLHQLAQLGGKMNPEHIDGQPMVIRPAFHTRFEHSELLAELAKFAGVRLGLTVGEIKTIMSAAWFHDIGHPAFSHAGDELLKEMGDLPHEKRTIQKIEGENIRPLLQAQGVDPQSVIESIEEKGALGTLQSALDTLSYLIVDSEMMESPFYTDAGAKVIASIDGVHENKLVVNDPNVWQEVLEFRAREMQDTIYHPLNKMVDESLRQLLRIALKKGYITAEELKNDTDDILRFKLQSLIQEDPGAAIIAGRKDTSPHLEHYKNLFTMSIGMPDMDQWTEEIYPLDDQDRVTVRSKIKDRLTMEPQQVQDQIVILEPYNYTKKKLHILKKVSDNNFEEYSLQAKTVELRPADKSFIVIMPNFIDLAA